MLTEFFTYVFLLVYQSSTKQKKKNAILSYSKFLNATLNI